MQTRPGRLDFPEYWKITFDLARQYGKSVGFRIMLENPDVPALGVPDCLADRVPYVKLPGTWSGDPSRVRYRKDQRRPRYDDPVYQSAFRELNGLLAEHLDGNGLVEYMDTFMYGFWGEGRTWPFEGNSFPDNRKAEETFVGMSEIQRE